MSSLETTITPGSWVLVTGATGFLASHVIKQLLQRGYRVRGTVRDMQKASWLLDLTSNTEHNLELVTVPDLGAEGAYDEAVKGVSAILHIAYVSRIVPDPNEVITPSVNGIRSIMNAAMREPSIKRAVFTSSAVSASPLTQGIDNGIITRDSWNDASLEAAWAPGPYGLSHAMANYPASKLAAEKEVWKFVDEHKLPFSVNVVAPAGLVGEPLTQAHMEANSSWIVHTYRGKRQFMDPMPATFYADVKDLALVHIGAVLDPELENARLQSWGHNTHWNDILAVLRKLRPEKTFIEDYPEPRYLKVSVDQSGAVELLKKWGNQDGWTPLERSIAENINNTYLTE